MAERFGPYKIVRLLGKGGMGSVFEAEHDATGQRGAVKILNQQFSADPHFRARFESEIEAMKQVIHPNIVRLFAFGEQDGQLFYVMEMVAGASLQDRIGQGKRFSAAETVKIGIGICHALRHAHDRGIVHRDLKPANVLWDGADVVKLTDFGIAKLFGSSQLTGEGGIIGTVEYMAPEQATGKPATIRSDLFSLGCVLFAMLSRKTPFIAKTIPEILHNVRYKEAPPISDLVDGVPDSLEKLIEKLLSKDPQNRIPTALAVSKRLEAIGEELAPAAAPETPRPAAPAPRPTAPPASPSNLHDRPTLQDAPVPAKPPAADRTVGGAGRGAATTPIGPDLGATGALPIAAKPAAPTSGAGHAPPRDSTAATGEFASVVDRAVRGKAPSAPTDAGAATGMFTREATKAAAGRDVDDSASFVLRGKTEIASRDSLAEDDDEANRFTTIEEERARRRAEEATGWKAVWKPLAIATPLILLLFALVVTIAVNAMPASADDLYGRVMEQTGPLEPNQYAVAMPAIDEFLSRFPDDDRAGELVALRENWRVAKERKNSLPTATGDVLALRPPVQRIYEEALAGVPSDPERSLVQLDALLAAFDAESIGAADRPYLVDAKALRDDLAKTVEAQRDLERRILAARIEEEAARLETDQAAFARRALAGLATLYAEKPWAADLAEQARTLSAEGADVN